jgi:arsenite methyltransferase
MKQDMLKAKIKERYGKIALGGDSEKCCGSECCNSTESDPNLTSISIGYEGKALESIPKSSILGLGSGAPINFANLKAGEIVVDLGSGAGIDAFLASREVMDSGKVIGIDFTENMLRKATSAAKEYGFTNVEFRQGDIEDRIPIEDNSVDVAISNCVINLATDKLKTFKEIYRILKKDGKGRMIISDLVTNKEVHREAVNADDWCNCIDGLMTKENYINNMREARFQNVRILNQQLYKDSDKKNERKITSLIIGALTGQ